MTAGDSYTVAGDGTGGFTGDGGPATRAQLAEPFGVGADGAGNLAVADTMSDRVRVVAASTGSFTDFGNNQVRVVAASTGTFYGIALTAGDIYTIAGDGTAGFTGDGGPATSASLNQPAGLALAGTHRHTGTMSTRSGLH